MQPRDQQRLEHILDYCEDIEKLVAQHGGSFHAFNADRNYQYALSFCILQIGELAGKLSGELREATADAIRWNAIKGMRNIVVHDYGSIDLDIVWDVATRDIPVLKAFCVQALDR